MGNRNPGKEDQPLISVIVPVYNGEDYLENCIESIEDQTYENLEIIIVNDGSTDGTAGICVELMQRFENIRVITREDEGVSVARNAGLDAAKGAFITFVDADDRLRPKAVQVLYDCIQKKGSDVAGCRFLTFHNEEEWTALLADRFRILEPEYFRPAAYLKQEILKGNSRCWSKLYRSAAIGQLRFEKGLSIGEDMLFLIDLLPTIRSVAETEYPGYGYYQNPGGAMNRKFTPSYMDQITCWELARERACAIDKSVRTEVTTILLMSIMLVAGKIALLPGNERGKQKQYVNECREKLKEELKEPGAYEGLPEDYKIKVNFFKNFPGLYLWLYGLSKRLSGQR